MDSFPGKSQLLRWLTLFLWLVALHSFLVGIALITTPSKIFVFIGFSDVTEKFFPVQGGVFHVVLSIAYAMAARDVIHQGRMVMLTISAKLIATVFLFSYFFIIDKIWVLLLSAIGDAFMGITVWYLYGRYVSFRDH